MADVVSPALPAAAPVLTAGTVLRYLLGNAAAIRAVATNRAALPLGLLLVLSAAIARNYDQTLFTLTDLRWLLRPLAVSCVSAAFLAFFLAPHWYRMRKQSERHTLPTRRSQVLGFFALFWMTAPIAWLYALPAERWMAPEAAARVNVSLLAIVAVWRVLLMARVLSVLLGWRFRQAFGKVLTLAAFEAGIIAGVGLASAVSATIATMGGLRNSPAENVLTSAAFITLLLILPGIITGMILQRWGPDLPETFLPARKPGRLPWIFLTIILAACLTLPLRPQQELRLTTQALEFEKRQDWPGLLALYSAHQPADFAPAIVLPPSPYELAGLRTSAALAGLLKDDTPQWIADRTLQTLENFTEADFYLWLRSPDPPAALLTGMLDSTRGRQWLHKHKAQMEFLLPNCYNNTESGKERLLPLLKFYNLPVPLDPPEVKRPPEP